MIHIGVTVVGWFASDSRVSVGVGVETTDPLIADGYIPPLSLVVVIDHLLLRCIRIACILFLAL